MNCVHEYTWRMRGCNEDGWECVYCKAKPGDNGYSPRLDLDEIREKVSSILMSLHMADFLYISNGDMGNRLSAIVADACVKSRALDQQSIIREIFARIPTDRIDPSKFWRERGEAARNG